MTIWGTHVFAKPLGRCVQRLRAVQAPENMPAMNNLVQTLHEYLHATDIKARDVFRKAIGRPTGDMRSVAASNCEHGPDTWLRDEDICAIATATCNETLVSANLAELISFARSIEAQIRVEAAAREA